MLGDAKSVALQMLKSLTIREKKITNGKKHIVPKDMSINQKTLILGKTALGIVFRAVENMTENGELEND